MLGAAGIGLEVERVLGNERDHAALVPHAVAAEHAAGLDAAEAFEGLVQALDKNAHDVISMRLPSGSSTTLS
ncbi:hypothetical protein D9M69_677180 [compost metagenome]